MSVKGNQNARKKIDWAMIDKLLDIACTGEEIASVLGINYDTIANHCKKEKGMLFSEYIKNGMAGFKVSLRRMQKRSAQGIINQDKDGNITIIERPSVTMQIWLGKNYLGQSDNKEIETDTDTKELIETIKDMNE